MTNIPDDIKAKAREIAHKEPLYWEYTEHFTDRPSITTVLHYEPHPLPYPGRCTIRPLTFFDERCIAAALLSERTAQEAEIVRLTKELADLKASFDANVNEMSQRFRAVNIAEVIKQSAFDFVKLSERLAASETRVAELEAMTEWSPINTAPLNTIVDVWCIEDGSPASCGNNIPSGEIIRNRHKSEKYGWFGNQSNDGVPRGHMPDMIPVAWRHRSPDAPIAIIEAFIAARAALTPAKENADAE